MGTSGPGVHPGVHNFRREKQFGILRNWNIVNSAKVNNNHIRADSHNCYSNNRYIPLISYPFTWKQIVDVNTSSGDSSLQSLRTG